MKLHLLLLLLLSAPDIAGALNCYYCKSEVYGEDCWNDGAVANSSKVINEPCDSPENTEVFCYIQRRMIGNTDLFISRFCGKDMGFELGCTTGNSSETLVETCVCNTDLCNLAPRSTRVSWPFLFSIQGAFLAYRCAKQLSALQ
ncbi:uncharacterized protein [Watersipora subatra]|uniref:uncharacterized protein n=1 Tax=Watersipora subatra TaxID=2589382 RepID=UPI00355B0019